MKNQVRCNLWRDMRLGSKSEIETEPVGVEESGISPQELFDTLLGPIRWNLILVGFELGVFDALSVAKTPTELAVELDLDNEKIIVLLDALCSLKVVVKKDPCYRLHSSIAPYILADSELSMRPMLLHLSQSRHANVEQILQTVKTGQANHISANFSKEDFWDRAMPNLRSFHRSLSNEIVLSILFSLPIWSSVKRFLDLGAGSECLASSIKESYPEVEATIFDLPSCAERIESTLSIENISIIGGDYNVDPLGNGYDLIWCSMALYYAADLPELLSKIKQSLTDGGVFVSFHEGLMGQRTLPETHVVGRFQAALNGNDVSFNKGQIAAALRSVGFAEVQSRTIVTPYGSMELDIAYNACPEPE